ncbi:hypothetical protein EYF80_049992 [Liparis tanakae]|uniref:Uncharacterized protein n=1 Tax=Liparis tanakae TaxID=230148 RepID=A0A4Z2FFW3_9TELE|nr:hypothetical protein EYF80_049992 [Liparis tanakae]
MRPDGAVPEDAICVDAAVARMSLRGCEVDWGVTDDDDDGGVETKFRISLRRIVSRMFAQPDARGEELFFLGRKHLKGGVDVAPAPRLGTSPVSREREVNLFSASRELR